MKLTGLIAAVHTPFDGQGELWLDAVEHQAQHLVQQQVKFAFICGSTGESHSLTVEERKLLAERWLALTRGSSLKVIVHVGANCLKDAGVLSRHAESLGAHATAALAPSYFKPNDVATLVACMATIAKQSPGIPFYFYDIPVLTNVRLSMPQFLESASREIPNLAGIKFTNEDFVSLQQCLTCNGGRWDILWGVDEALLGALAFGVQGAVGSSYNFAAPIYQRLLSAFANGDHERARVEQLRSVATIQVLAKFGYLPAAKVLMERLGVPVGGVRLPLRTLEGDRQRLLITELEQLGFFEWISHA